MDTPRLLKNILEKDEHHRQLIAYEIHDGVAQYISAAIMQLEASKANPKCDRDTANDPHVNLSLIHI